MTNLHSNFKKCRHCGTENNKAQTVCFFCGKELGNVESDEATTGDVTGDDGKS